MLNRLNSKFRKFPNGLKIVCSRLSKDIDFIYNEIFTERTYFKNGISLKDGDCVFDIGANVGMFSLFCLLNFRNIKVYAFEPMPATFRFLSRNIQLLNRKLETHPSIYQLGLADSTCSKELIYYPKAPGSSSLFAENKNTNLDIFKSNPAYYVRKYHKLRYFLSFLILPFQKQFLLREVNSFYKEEKCLCSFVSLSKFIEDHGVSKINLLKIDVEGAELDVFKGIKDGHWEKIDQISMEVHSSLLLTEVSRILTIRDYTVFSESSKIPNDTFNLYAVKGSRSA